MDISIISDELNAGSSTHKMLEFFGANLATDGVPSGRGIVYYGRGQQEMFGPLKRLGPDNFAYLGLRGNSFKVELQIESPIEFRLSDISVDFKLTDKRIPGVTRQGGVE